MRLILVLCAVSAVTHALPTPPAAVPIELADAESSRRLQAAAAPPPPKAKVSLWSAAKRFFLTREKMKTKALEMKSKPAGATIAKTATTPAATPTMSAKYGVSFKAMLTWWCAKSENKEKSLCKLHAQGKSTDGTISTQPSSSDAKDAFKAYCAEEAHKAKLICVQSKVHAALSTAHTAVKKAGEKSASAVAAAAAKAAAKAAAAPKA